MLKKIHNACLKNCWCLLVFWLSGCLAPQVDFQWGWTTQQIQGTFLDEQEKPMPTKEFLLVRLYYPQFVEVEDNKQHYFPNAKLVFPDPQGNFVIPFDLGAAKADVTFVASGYVMENYSFKRQLGVGDISLHVKMRKTAAWQDHLFVTVSPFLEQFILEQQFALVDAHQLYLGDWLSNEKERHRPKSL